MNSRRFAPRLVYGDLDLTAGPFLVEFGYDLGNGVTVYDDMESLLRDGTLISSTSTGNRTATLSVLVEDGDSHTLAGAGALLDAETEKAFNTLTVYPGDGVGFPTVLDTFVAQSNHDWDTDLEQSGLRRFLLTIPALPGTRSVDPVTINWTGSSTEIDACDSLTGWTVVSGSVSVVSGGIRVSGTTPAVLRKSFTLDEFLWFEVDPVSVVTSQRLITGMKVDGVAIADAAIRQEGHDNGENPGYYTVDTGNWRGQTVTVEFTLRANLGGGTSSSDLLSIRSLTYPNATNAAGLPRGIGTITTPGTARSGCVIRFTAPAGGAFVYTAPDPIVAIRERGKGEIAFGSFTVASANGATVTLGETTRHFVQGTHADQIGAVAPQPLELNPNGPWPQVTTGAFSAGGATGTQYAYPNDSMAAVTFFETAGAKALVTPGIRLPEGYHSSDATAYEPHELHPGRMGVGVFDINSNPIAATIEFYPRWKHHAGQ